MQFDAQKTREVRSTSRWPPEFSGKGVLIAAAVFVVLVFGTKVNFFRSDAWSPQSLWATALVNVLSAALFMRGAMRNKQGLKGMRFNVFTGTMVAALFYALTLLVTYFLVAFTIPEVFTRLGGTPFEIHDVHFFTHQGSYRGGCPREVHSPLFELGGPHGYYCAGRNEYAALGKEGTAHVYGRQSWFGRHIDYLEPEETPRR